MTETICFPFAADIPVGGGHPSAMLLMQGLDQMRFRPILALHGEHGPAGRWLADHGANFQQVRFPSYAGGVPRNPARDLAWIARHAWPLARFLKKERIAIVHANDIWLMGTWALAAKLAGVKLIWHHRSDARFALAHRLAFHAADRMIAVSDYAAGRRAHDPKCVVVANPFQVDVDAGDRGPLRKNLLDELGLEEPVHVLGFFGNLKASWSERKRPFVLIEALARLNELGPPANFVAAFYGTVNDDFRTRIDQTAKRLGVDRQVFIMSFRSPVEPELVAVDTVVAPAVEEGFGRVPVEAMMVGTPVVASASGNHPALVRDGETGVLVTPDDPAALAQKILWLARDPAARSRIIGRAREFARARFGVEASASAVMRVYDGLLSSAEDHADPTRANPADAA